MLYPTSPSPPKLVFDFWVPPLPLRCSPVVGFAFRAPILRKKTEHINPRVLRGPVRSDPYSIFFRSFGELNLNFDRIIIASLLQWLNNFHKTIQTVKSQTDEVESTGEGGELVSIGGEKTQKLNARNEVIALRLNFTMVSLSTSLFRNGAIFLYVNLPFYPPPLLESFSWGKSHHT